MVQSIWDLPTHSLFGFREQNFLLLKASIQVACQKIIRKGTRAMVLLQPVENQRDIF
ncbi:MAG TPA: hypothetical protein VF581_03945 [Flavobacterium sp.]|jgi:hypothetical protein